jgi:hypothetical protein
MNNNSLAVESAQLHRGVSIDHCRDIGVDLYWLPLGAGGHFVRFNGRVYEWIKARKEHRIPCDLYHTALEVVLPEGRYVIENAWPIPDRDGAARGVTVQGPVFSRGLGRFSVFRYEVRRWRGGAIADAGVAVDSPQRLSDDEGLVRRVLELADSVPAHVWGRDELSIGEMWNSNSVISWVLSKAGLPALEIRPPEGGRAPGWESGVVAAMRSSVQESEGQLQGSQLRSGSDLGPLHLTVPDRSPIEIR